MQKLLQDIDRLLAEAPDEASRRELQRLRDSPEYAGDARHGARAARAAGPPPGNLVLEFHDPLLPDAVTAAGLRDRRRDLPVRRGRSASRARASPSRGNDGQPVDRRGVRGRLSRRCSPRCRSCARSPCASTPRAWRRAPAAHAGSKLRVGAMRWKDIRSLHERREDRVLEVRAAGGEVFEIPMRVANYPILRQHLDNMVRLYGDRPAALSRHCVPSTLRSFQASSSRRADTGTRVFSCCANSDTRNSSSNQRNSSSPGGLQAALRLDPFAVARLERRDLGRELRVAPRIQRPSFSSRCSMACR